MRRPDWYSSIFEKYWFKPTNIFADDRDTRRRANWSAPVGTGERIAEGFGWFSLVNVLSLITSGAAGCELLASRTV